MTYFLSFARKIPTLYTTLGCIAVGTALLTVWQTRHMGPVFVPKVHAMESRLSTCERLLFHGHSSEEIDMTVEPADVFSGTPATVQFLGAFLDAYTFRTRIRSEVKQGANFAGHYTVVSIGCGTNCANHALVDTKTGRIIAFGLPSTMGASYNIRSRLLILNPKERFPALDSLALSEHEMLREWSVVPRSYYMLEDTPDGGVLRLLCVEHPFDGQFLPE